MDTVAITIVGQLRWTRCHNYDCWPLACQYRLGHVRCTASHYCHTCMLRCLQLCDGRTVWDVVCQLKRKYSKDARDGLQDKRENEKNQEILKIMEETDYILGGLCSYGHGLDSYWPI